MQQGYLSESAIDTALVRLFTARIRLGMFDPPGRCPYSKINENELNSPAHRDTGPQARRRVDGAAEERWHASAEVRSSSIAVVGPLADQTRVLLGNYTGIPTHTVSILDGLKTEFPNAKITFVPGTQFLRNDGNPVPDNLLTTPDGKPGSKRNTPVGRNSTSPRRRSRQPIASRVEPNVDLGGEALPAEAAGRNPSVCSGRDF